MAPGVGSLVPTSWCSTYVLIRNTKEYLFKQFYTTLLASDRIIDEKVCVKTLYAFAA